MINKLDTSKLNCNVFSVYDYPGLTVQELLSQFFTKINECIDISNESKNMLEWLKEVGLPVEVSVLLNKWLVDGTLENIINENLFNSLYTKLNQVENYIDNAPFYINNTYTINEINTIIQNKSNIVFKKGNYMVSPNSYIKVTGSNKTITFENGAVIKQIDNLNEFYVMFEIRTANNIIVNNINIDGLMPSNTPPDDLTGGNGPGAWGYGVEITCSNNIEINNPVIKNTTGDGVYIGYKWEETLANKTEMITINNPYVDGVSRNGIAVCGGSNIHINNLTAKNITRCFPKSAIDIEPENNNPNKIHLENVYIDTVNSFNNGTSISVNMELLNSGLIDLKNIYSTNDFITFVVEKYSCVGGMLNISNVKCVNNKNHAMFFNKVVDNGNVNINKINIFGKSIPHNNAEYFLHCNFIFTHSGSSTNLGGIYVNDVTINTPGNKYSATSVIKGGVWKNIIFNNVVGDVKAFRNDSQNDNVYKLKNVVIPDTSTWYDTIYDRNFISNYCVAELPLEQPTRKQIMSSLPNGEYIMGHNQNSGHKFTLVFDPLLTVNALSGILTSSHLIETTDRYANYKLIKQNNNITVIKN